MLLLCCLSGIGCYMGQDIHTILARSFHNEIGLEKYDFDYLYSIIMFPNLILPFFGGYICDHYSGVKALVLFTAIITIGQFMAVVSVWGQSYWMFYVSRIVYALTKECVIVAVRLIITRWFYATFLGLAIGLPITIWRLFAIYAPFMYPGMMDTNGELDDS
jgi:MFS family permease